MSGTTSGVAFSSLGEDTHMQIFQGKTISFEVIWGGSTPIDVTGYSATLQIRDLKGALMLEMSTSNGKVSVGGSDGKFSFSASESDSRAVTRAGQWELELTAPNGDIYRALSGTVTPIMEITQ